MSNQPGSNYSDFFTPEFTRNPYPVYAKMRQQEPVFRILFPDGQYVWLITQYEDAVQVLKDPRFSKDVAKRYGAEHATMLTNNMLF
ncbi:cytochrome P450, partial [Escherichia coli]|nr:cytochrome P450 [Escherichia coli]